MEKEIISSIIEAAGVIIAAIIATHGAKSIAKETTAKFRSYSDPNLDVQDLLGRAKNDVLLVFMIGDKFFDKYSFYIKRLMRRGITVHCLLLTKEMLLKSEEYISEDSDSPDFREKIRRKYEDTIELIRNLKQEFGQLFDCKESCLMMTASYICIDFFPDPPNVYLPSSQIQAMIYQYNTKASKMPITYLSPKADENVYLTTHSSILNMWNDSSNLKL